MNTDKTKGVFDASAFICVYPWLNYCFKTNTYDIDGNARKAAVNAGTTFA